MQIGYVAAERTMLIRRAWEEAREVRAIFQAATAYGAVIRVSFDGNEPSLPPVGTPDVRVPADSDPDWGDQGDRWDGVDDLPPEG